MVDVVDEQLPLMKSAGVTRTDGKPRIDPIVLRPPWLANACSPVSSAADWTAVGIVFTATLVGFAARAADGAHGVNHFDFHHSAFMASLCASSALRRLYG